LGIRPSVTRHAYAALLLLAVVLSQARLVEATNFFGFDEWTVLSLLSRWVIDIPYANRPLGLLWALPVTWIAPHSFLGFAILYWFYLWLTGLLVYWLALRVAPRRPLLAVLAGVFAVVWAPSDLARQSTVERALYIGITFGMLLAMVCYVESWLRRSVPLLALSLLLCVVSGRCYEATLPVLMVTPLLLFAVPGESTRALRQWILVFECFVLLSMLLALQSFLAPTSDFTYQAAINLDPRPAAVLTRLALQYRLHFAPLFTVVPTELLTSGVAVAVVVFLSACILWLWGVPEETAARRDLRMLCLGGVLLAGAGYGALLLTARVPDAWRMQFLSSPGAALLLAGVVVAIGERTGRYAPVVAVALGAWVVAVGTGRTQTMQQRWERLSFYPRQMRMLSALVAEVPDAQPGALLLLIDDGRAWRANFGFHHAVEYLYRGHAVGLAWGVWTGMFPAFFGPEGVASEAWPAVRRAWGARATFHRYDQIIVLRHSPNGAVQVLDAWPADLPPLPPGTVYRPRAQLVPLREALPEREILAQAASRLSRRARLGQSERR
jgi:hypothetical protein